MASLLVNYEPCPLTSGHQSVIPARLLLLLCIFFCFIDRCQKIFFFSYLYLTKTMKCTLLWHKTRLDCYIRYIHLKPFEYPLYLFISFRIQVLNNFWELQNRSILKSNSLIYEKGQKHILVSMKSKTYYSC